MLTSQPGDSSDDDDEGSMEMVTPVARNRPPSPQPGPSPSESSQISHVTMHGFTQTQTQSQESQSQKKKSQAEDSDTESLAEEALMIEEERANPPPGVCKPHYLCHRNSKPMLFAMAIGLTSKDGTRKLYDITEDPYKSLSQKSSYYCGGVHMKSEMKRRALVFGMKEPRNKNYDNAKCRTWLEQHPITNLEDITFIVEEEEKTLNILLAAVKEKEQQEQERLLNANWNSWQPHVRLYLAMGSDEARSQLQDKDETLLREELDARNSDARPPSFYAVVAKKYNNPDWVPTTEALPDLHHDFNDPVELHFHDMPGGEITPEEVKTRFGDARAKLIQIIANWEKSGNGFGQRSETEEGWGNFSSDHMLECGDNRSGFVKTHLGQHGHHLYVWHLSDNEGIL